MIKFVPLVILPVLVSLALAACGGAGMQAPTGDDPRRDERSAAVAETAPKPHVSPRRARATRRRSVPALRRPSIDIVGAAEGEAVTGDTVTLSVAVKGFKLVDQRVRPPFPSPVAGQGHVHYYLDTKRLPTTHSPPATGVYRSTSQTSYTWTRVAAGRHSFAVQLVGRDHAPLRPAVKDWITAEVE